ncbi:hypothetical protein DPMN_080253 [Dreissena polymorpha]|uniref:Uncharacterized protein n=1 Tax=Dreissena polymorpha TaxID=45954 RepID=A0A9D3YQI3_DREPO|nr:hypothetical protein DPMN_080253 [Dreissena polymorpha]
MHQLVPTQPASGVLESAYSGDLLIELGCLFLKNRCNLARANINSTYRATK